VLPNGDVGFRFGSYDSRQPLVIDPVLTFSTYLSPLGSVANLIATDASGNNYVSGIASLGFPVTPDAFAGCVNCTTNNVVTFISKLSADGTTLIYSTVLGGNSFAQPKAGRTAVFDDRRYHSLKSTTGKKLRGARLH
jgi:hypothetical protein